jgi:DNA-directed RNA polymerase subunit N (RpoN/RPB10)
VHSVVLHKLKKKESKLSEEKNLVDYSTSELHDLAKEFVPNFETLKNSFGKFDKNFLKDLKKFVGENLSRTEHAKESAYEQKKRFIREVRKQASKQKVLLSDYQQFKLKTHNLKEKIKKLIEEKVEKNKNLQELEKSLKLLIQEQKRRRSHLKTKKSSSKKAKGKHQESPFSPKNINLDVPGGAGTPRARALGSIFLIPGRLRKGRRSARRSAIENPKTVMMLKINTQKEEIQAIGIEVENCGRVLRDLKMKRIQCKAMLLKTVGFLLKYPDFVHELGLRIQDSVRTKMVVDEQVLPCQIGGEFTEPEKEYLIQSTLAEMKWEKAKEHHENVNKIMKKLSFNEDRQKKQSRSMGKRNRLVRKRTRSFLQDLPMSFSNRNAVIPFFPYD